jgi:DNA-binding PadR family transcriptional regulator
LLTSERGEDNERRKRFYRLTRNGNEVRDHLLAGWRALNASVGRIVQEHVR